MSGSGGRRVRNRRYLAVATRSGEGPVTEPTADAQPWRRERVLMPQSDLCWRTKDRSARLGKQSFDRAARFLSHRDLAVPRASELHSRAMAGFVNLQIA